MEETLELRQTLSGAVVQLDGLGSVRASAQGALIVDGAGNASQWLNLEGGRLDALAGRVWANVTTSGVGAGVFEQVRLSWYEPASARFASYEFDKLGGSSAAVADTMRKALPRRAEFVLVQNPRTGANLLVARDDVDSIQVRTGVANDRVSVNSCFCTVRIDSSGGDDVIDLIDTAGTVFAGDGRDAIRVSSSEASAVSVFGGPGADVVTWSYAAGVADGGSGNDRIELTSFALVTVRGQAGNDHLDVNADGTVDGGDGNDYLDVAGGVAAVARGGAGNDFIVYAASIGSVDGGADNDVISVTWADEVTVRGGRGDDYISVRHAVRSVIDGGPGRDGIQAYIASSEEATIYNWDRLDTVRRVAVDF
jgi:hypothetical protein